ncbi:unnamed protein product [Rotaria magnacalcarata]|uniref:Uncharacterized protein n=1 Tax=Rotaria magnacalcarata TaxID=392030 RepID=A0A816PUR3_9BILA|nr:unnamed protein product [Rotaria magnacalcarata]
MVICATEMVVCATEMVNCAVEMVVCSTEMVNCTMRIGQLCHINGHLCHGNGHLYHGNGQLYHRNGHLYHEKWSFVPRKENTSYSAMLNIAEPVPRAESIPTNSWNSVYHLDHNSRIPGTSSTCGINSN